MEHIKQRIKELFQELSKNIDELYDIAIHDQKTGIYNSKFFDTLLDLEIEQAKRGSPLCLLIIDIDFFKKVNDKYGHLVGDRILVRVSKLMEKYLRKSDIISRFGGEEFFILLQNTKFNRAKEVVNRLKSSIEKDNMVKRYKVTISGGLTKYKKGDTRTSLKERADKALYKAKKAGKNKIEVL